MTKRIIGIWFVMWWLTWPALLGDLEGRLQGTRCMECYRRDLAFAMMMGAFPPMWFVAPFLTGFYMNGFQIMPNSGYAG